MIRLQPAKDPYAFITSDGVVLASFAARNDDGRRSPVSLIKSIELAAGSEGKGSPELATYRTSLNQELLAEMQKAISTKREPGSKEHRR